MNAFLHTDMREPPTTTPSSQRLPCVAQNSQQLFLVQNTEDWQKDEHSVLHRRVSNIH